MRKFNLFNHSSGQEERQITTSCLSLYSDLPLTCPLQPLHKMLILCMLLFAFGGMNVWGADVTFDVASDSGSGSITKSGITVSMSTMNRSQKDNFRCNANTDMVVSSTSGNITSVTITCTGNNNNDYSPSKFSLKSGSSGSYNNGGSGSKVGTWTGNASTFTLTASAQVRITKIVVTYSATASCDKKVTIIKGTPETGGSFSLDKTGERDCCSALTVTVSNITAPSGKEFDAITQSGIVSGVTINQSAKTVTYAANSTGTSTINVTFRDLPKYTVTLKDDDSELTQASAGASVTLPERTGCTGYTFAGWTKSWATAQTTWTTTAPTIIPAGSYTPSADENLYPVYTKTEGGGTTTVTKVYSGTNTADVQFSTGSNNSSNSLVNNTGYTAGNVNVKFAVTSGTNYSYYDGSVVRFYANNTITITPNSATITKVQFVRSSSSSSNSGVISTTGLTASNSNSSTNTNEYTGSATSAVTFTNNGQCRFSVINVTYTYSSSTTSYISVPNCCTPLAQVEGSANLSQWNAGVHIY